MSFSKNKAGLLFLLLFCFLPQIGADEIFEIKDTSSRLNIGTFIEILPSERGKYQLSEVKNPAINALFYRPDRRDVSFGFRKEEYWIKLSLWNNSPEEIFILELDHRIMDNISFFEPNESGGYTEWETGYYFPYSSRPIPALNFAFQLTIPSGTTRNFYLKVSSEDRMELPFYISSTAVYTRYHLVQNIIYGMFYGILLSTIIIQIFLFIWTRDRTYFATALFYFSYLLFQATQDGVVSLFGSYGGIITRMTHFTPLIISLCLLTSLILVRRYNSMEIFSPGLYRFLGVMEWVYLANMIVVLFIPFFTAVKFEVIVAIIHSVFIYFSGAQGFRKQHKPSLYFTAAWVFFVLGILLYSFKCYAILPSNELTMNSMKYGFIIAIGILSFGLADQVYSLDVQTKQRKDWELHVQKIYHRRLFENSPVGNIYLNSDFSIIEVNQKMVDMFQYSPRELVNKNLFDILSPSLINMPIETFSKELHNKRSLTMESPITRKDNSTIFMEICFSICSINIQEESYRNEEYIHCQFRDITELKETEQEINHLAFHDPLTELPNRRYLMEELSQKVISAGKRNSRFFLLFLDLDRFKVVNDRWGHDYGDVLLKEASERLAECLRLDDFIARQGGDEFCILLNRVNQETVEDVAKRLIGVIKNPFVVENETLNVGVSIGLVSYPESGKDSTTLLRHADIAMYEAKRKKSGFVFYSSGMETRLVDER